MTTTRAFVGRNRELQLLEDLLRHAQDGDSRFAVVLGEAGMGKTTLVTRVAELARGVGATVLWGRASEFGGAPAFWPLTQVLRELSRLGTAWRDAVAPALDGAFGESGDEGEREGGRFRLQLEMADALRTRPDGRVRVFVFEDLHAADIDSLRVLGRLTESWQEDGLLVIATARNTDADWTPEAKPIFTKLCRRGVRIELHGVDEAAVAQLLAAHVDASGAAALAREMRQRSGGNPLFLEGLLHATATGSARVPETVQAAIEQRLEGLSPELLHVLSLAALFGARFECPLLSELSELPAVVLQRLLQEAVAQGLLVPGVGEEWAFAHALFADELERRFEPEARAILHARIARTIEARSHADGPTRMARLVRHYGEAAGHGYRPQAFDAAQRAAAMARRACAYDAEASYRAQALRHAAPGSEAAGPRIELRIAAGDAALRAGQRQRARELLAAAFDGSVELDEPELAAAAAVGFSRTSPYGVQDVDAIRMLEHCVRDDRPDALCRARVHARLALSLWWSADSLDRRETLSARGVELARQGGDPATLVETLAARSTTLWSAKTLAVRREMAAEMWHLAADLPDASLRFEAARWGLNAAWEGGDARHFQSAVTRYQQAAMELMTPQALMNLALRRATLAQVHGDFDEAERQLERLRIEGDRADDPQTELYVAYGRVYPCIATGQLDRLRAELPRLERGAVVWRMFPAAAFVPSQAFIALDDRAAMRRWLDMPLPPASADLWGHPSRLGMMIELAIALDDRDRLAELRDELLPHGDQYLWSGVGMPMGPAGLSLARACEHLGDAAAARAHYVAAAQQADGVGDRPRAAQARRALQLLGGVDGGEEGSPQAQGDGASNDGTGPTGSLRRDGAGWQLDFRGKRSRVKASRGMTLIARLVGQAGVELHALDLAGDPGAVHRVDADLGPALDAQSREAYGARVRELREMLAEAEANHDLGGAERARGELDFIAAELSRSTGLGGRDRPQGAAAERARVAVKKAIRRALRAIEDQDPALGRHLDNALRTGTFCAYDPEPGQQLRVLDDD